MADWRPMNERERGIVASSWVRSYADSQQGRLLRPRKHYDDTWNGIVDRAFAECEVRVIEDPPTGLVSVWACVAPGVIHYVYVRLPDRRQGLVRRILADYWEKDAICTHLSRAVQPTRLPPQWQFRLGWWFTNRRAA